ncbi:MAG: hypothetical protein H6808_08445 [Phycisphaera sp.]|nr:hypothetical protein [Phycisphaera sp.]
MTIVKPDTLVRWIKATDTKRKPKPTTRRPGRPRTPEDIRQIILRIARETGWGYTRILGELKKLDIHVSRSTVVNILRQASLPTGPERGEATWDQFIKSHAESLWACDFVQQRILTLMGWRDAYLLVFVNVATRRAIATVSTEHPDARWVTQQASTLKDLTGEKACRVLTRDSDTKFGKAFDGALRDIGVTPVRLPHCSPNLNAHAEGSNHVTDPLSGWVLLARRYTRESDLKTTIYERQNRSFIELERGMRVSQAAWQTSLRMINIATIALSSMGALTATGQATNETTKLLSSDGAEGDNFGWSVAISDTTAVVGAWHDRDNGPTSGSAYLFDITTGQQIAKLLPSDGNQGDEFGWSVAISDTRAVIGAWQDRDNGPSSGSAYLFDATTGQQIAKLLPGDVGQGDRFGFSVAINGTTAVIGAQTSRNNGVRTGSAYLFNSTTGQQISKLLPSDGAAVGGFGCSVSISGTTAVIGVNGDDDNAIGSGSAYVFDTTTGQQIVKLLPIDGAAFDEFGNSVAISGNTAVVGATGDDDNGSDSGSAYVFDTSTGQQIAKLLPSDGTAGDRFGWSVAISGTTALIGASQQDSNGIRSGSAYLFDTTTGQQIAKLLPSDGATDHWFGVSVAINGDTAVIGAYKDNDNGIESGSAYLFSRDNDDDGIPDDWEINGIPYTDSNGFSQRYILDSNGDGQSDADPLKKDIFVEVDAMAGRAPSAATLQRVVDAFDPPGKVLVPAVPGLAGGQPNVNLHIQHSGERSLTLTNNGDYGSPMINPWLDFAVDKAAYFGTTIEREGPDAAARLEAKRMVYRYCIFANTHSGGSSGGLAEGIPSDDFMVTLGAFPTTGGTVDEQAGTFMHELGHALGLGHGGGDNLHYKPNYYSVMNYWWTMPNAWQGATWGLRYSEHKLPTLDEMSLSEPSGIGAMLPGVVVPYRMSGASTCSTAFCWQNPQTQDTGCFSYASLANNAAVDWNSDCHPTPGTVSADLNDLSFLLPVNATFDERVANGSGLTPLEGHNDWLNLHYNVQTTPTFAPGSSPQELYCRYDSEVIAFMSSIPPPPTTCLADTNGDGMVTPADFSAWVAAFNTQTPECDQNGDGSCTPADFSAWVANYNAGCN